MLSDFSSIAYFPCFIISLIFQITQIGVKRKTFEIIRKIFFLLPNIIDHHFSGIHINFSTDISIKIKSKILIRENQK